LRQPDLSLVRQAGQREQPDALSRQVVGFCNTGCRDKFEAATRAFDAKFEGKE